MNPLLAFSYKLSRIGETLGYKAFLFLVMQLLATLLILHHLHSLQVREQALIELRLQNQTIVMRDNLRRIFEVADIAADSLRESLLKKFTTDTSFIISLFLKGSITKTVPMISTYSLYDEKGDIYATSYDSLGKKVNVSDRPYFVALKGGEDSTYFGPYYSRLSDRWSYTIVHRMFNPDNTFSGVLTATMDLAYIGEFCKDLTSPDGISTYLLNKENVIVIQCINDKSVPEFVGKKLTDAVKSADFNTLTIGPLSNKYETTGWVYFTSVVPDQSELKIVTMAPKEVAYQALSSLVTQNYVMFAYIIAAELACFLMYFNALLAAFERRKNSS